MAAVREQIGTMKCWSCKREVPVKKTPGGKLSAACPWCDFPHYANQGTEHYANMMKDTTLLKKEPPPRTPPKQPASAVPVAPSQEDATATPPAPAAKPKLPWEV